MTIPQKAAIAAGAILVFLMTFQLLLARGVPLGRAAWGGKHRVLPKKLRWASLAAVGVLGLACWAVLSRAGLLSPGPEPVWVRVSTWFFAGCMSLNTIGNIVSKSNLERIVMTPVAVLLALCFTVVALS
jgi:hypothetical protein